MDKKKQNKFQDVKLSTESVMTPTIADNSVSRPVDKVNDSVDKPISKLHKDYDTDLARDNLENDITAVDLQDL